MTLEEIKMLGFSFALGRRVANMRALARDAEFVQPKNSQWVTFENKQRVLIDKSSGEILLGLGDQNGKMIDELSEGKKAVGGKELVVDIKRRRGGRKNWMNTHYAHFAKDEEMRAEEVELVCVRWK